MEKILRKIKGELQLLRNTFSYEVVNINEFIVHIEKAIAAAEYNDENLNEWIQYIQEKFSISEYLIEYGAELIEYLNIKNLKVMKSNIRELMRESGIKNLSELSRISIEKNVPISRTSLNKIYHDNELEKNKLETYIKLTAVFNCTLNDLFINFRSEK